MLKVLSTVTLILFILLTPPAVLALITQDALPGDVRYPIKRKLEDGILFIVSIHPVTKAWFSVKRSERRFQEATTLLSRGYLPEDTLKELIIQTNVAAKEIQSLKNLRQKKEYSEKLIVYLQDIDKKLSLVDKTLPGGERVETYKEQLSGIKNDLESKLEQSTPFQTVPDTTQTLAPTLVPTLKPFPVPTAKTQNTKFQLGPTFAPKASSSPFPTFLPEPTLTPTPTQASLACYDDYPPTKPSAPSGSDWEYYWYANCSKYCESNNWCDKNYSDSHVNPDTSNWCYGNRCYQLKTRSI